MEGAGRRHAGERRLLRSTSPRESDGKRWPAANGPQTPSAPGARGPPGFDCHPGPGTTPAEGAGRGAPAGRSGSRIRRVTSPMLAIASGAEEPASGRERCKAIAWGPTSVSRADFPSPTYIHRPCWDPCPACKGLVAKKGLHFDDFCMANVKLGCIPYKNRPDRSPVEWAGRGLRNFQKFSTAPANCRKLPPTAEPNRQLPNQTANC